jgi:hypothetical protein
MRNGIYAERLLSLFTRPDYAQSIVGDLTEGARHRGLLWFYTHVSFTALRLLCRNLSTAPIRAGALVILGLYLTHISFRPVFPFMIFQLMRSLGWLPLGRYGYEIAWSVSNIVWPLVIGQFLIGLLLAFYAPGREVAICAALAFDNYLLFLAYWAWIEMTGRPDESMRHFSLINLIPVTMLIVAALLVHRWRSKTKTTEIHFQRLFYSN